MAKKAYVGVNGISKNVKNIYVGVNGVPKKVVKGYVGVNGVAKLFWDGGTPPTPVIAGSWDFWSSVAGTTLFTIEYNGTPWSYQKENNMIAYYAIICVKPNVGNINYFPLFLSPVSTATSFQTIPSSSPHIYSGSVTDKMGISWRYASGETVFDVSRSSISPQGCLLNTIETYYTQNTEGIRQAALDLIDRIYSVPFQSDYQSGQTYTLYAADQRKTLRKVYSTYLHRNINKYGSSAEYRALSDNADTIINTLINTVQSYSASGSVIGIGVVEYEVAISYGTTSSWGYDVTQIDNASLEGQSISNNYKLYRFSIPNPSYPEFPDIGVYPDWQTMAQIDSSGQITYDTLNGWDVQITGIDFHAGVEFSYYDEIKLTNIGIDL